eukprot:TRINITY_DN2025_c3_g1_i4.p1 TRINITY_DN2025_c3_g1~~TRINITY_DN2025_c3_g1_i4.p1  ORF type:complete len:1864 (+),score=575.12 TRINITY_DN2025_c3_g1_i4:699-5594(+)
MGYFSDRFNILDGSVVIVSLIEFALSRNSSVIVFRALRLLRVFKLLKNFPELKYLVEVILQAVSDTGYLNMIILLYLLTTALLGKELFGGEFHFREECEESPGGFCRGTMCKDGRGPCLENTPRATFDNFYWSVVTVFQVLTRDDWVNVMWNAMRATHWLSAVYFIILVICGDFLILNLFLAILIQSFDQNMRTEEDEEDGSSDEEIEAPPPPPPDEAPTAKPDRRSTRAFSLADSMAPTPTGAVLNRSGRRESVVRTEAFRSGSVINIQTTILSRAGMHNKMSVMMSQIPETNRTLHPSSSFVLQTTGKGKLRPQRSFGVFRRLSSTDPHAELAELVAGSPKVSPSAPPKSPRSPRAAVLKPEFGSSTQVIVSDPIRSKRQRPRRLSALEVAAGMSLAPGAQKRMSLGDELVEGGRRRSSLLENPRRASQEARGAAPPLPNARRQSDAEGPPVVKGFCISPTAGSPDILSVSQVSSSTISSGSPHAAEAPASPEERPQFLNPFLPGLRTPSQLSVVSNQYSHGATKQSGVEFSESAFAEWMNEQGVRNSLMAPRDEQCPRCGEALLHASSFTGFDEALGKRLHDEVCPTIRLRQIREQRIQQMLRATIQHCKQKKVWTSEEVESLLSMAWEVGLFLEVTPADLESVVRSVDVRPDVQPSFAWDDSLVITEVVKETAAARVGIRRGHTVVSVDAAPIGCPRELHAKLAAAREEQRPCSVQIRSHRDWTDILAMCEVQLRLLDLRIGEEQLGRSFLANVHGRQPPVYHTNGGRSLFLFGPKNKVRVLVYRLVQSQPFDNFILGCILLASILMIAENPRESEQWGKEFDTVIFILNYVFTSIFVLEMCLKVIAFGFILTNHEEGGATDPPYLRDSWNSLDGMIVIISVLALVLKDYNVGFLKVLRAFRALRPLRVVSRRRGLRMVVITLLRSMSSIGYVALVTILVFLVFGILGVQLFAGKTHECTDPAISVKVACSGWWYRCEGSQCEWLHRSWTHGGNRQYLGNFDNILNSFLTLFEVATLELWATIMYGAIDATSTNSIPRRDAHPYFSIYFVVFIVIGSFFILNLFVGFVIFNFNQVKEETDRFGTGGYLTKEQQLWIETQRMMMNFSPVVRMEMREGKHAKRAHLFARSHQFELFIGACIFANVIVMGMEHHGMNETWNFTLDRVNDLFALIFIVEAGLKIYAFSLSYFKDGWNKFDFALVLLSLIQWFFFFFSGLGAIPIKSNILRVFRIFRIMRILRLVKSAKDVRVLLETIWYSLPQIANIGAFLLLLFFIYAVLGVNLYAKVKRGEYLTRHANFETFWRALLMLMRVVTGENWNGVMHETMVQEPECSETRDDCGNYFAPIYFLTFILLATFILTNLFVAIILDNFKTTILIEKSDLRMRDLHRFIDIWSEFDPDASLRMPTAKFRHLLTRLGPPLGIRNSESRVDILLRTKQYCIPEHAGQIHFIETLIPLARQVMMGQSDMQDYNELRSAEEQWRQFFPDINSLPVLRFRQKRCTVDQYFSSTYIAAAYRRAVACRKFKELRHARRARQAAWMALHAPEQCRSPSHMQRSGAGAGIPPKEAEATAASAAAAPAPQTNSGSASSLQICVEPAPEEPKQQTLWFRRSPRGSPGEEAVQSADEST